MSLYHHVKTGKIYKLVTNVSIKVPILGWFHFVMYVPEEHSHPHVFYRTEKDFHKKFIEVKSDVS